MFLKRSRRKINGEVYEYWRLVKTVRTARGPRHQTVATLGKEPGLDSQSRHGWEEVSDLLEGRPPGPRQMHLGEKGTGSATTTQPADSAASSDGDQCRQWMQVDVRGLRVENVRQFGQVYLALALWRRLGLHTLLREVIEDGRVCVSWELTACILTIARFCGNKSELEVAERWYQDSALEDLLGVSWQHINDSRLYRGLDVLHGHKDTLCKHLMARYESWFGVAFEFLLYDVTSTYFEGDAAGNAKAKRGYSRDNRPDCKQVNIGLVVTPEGGLPIGYEVFDGNTADVTTVEDMVRLMEDKYGKARRIWVMDRGMVSENNIDFLRAREARYIVGTPKGQLRKFERAFLDESDWAEVRPGVEVKLVAHPDGNGQEQYVMCRSADRRKKEAAMLEQKRARLLAKLEAIDSSLRKRPAKIEVAERRVGRWLGRYPAAERVFSVAVLRDEHTGRANGLQITRKEAPLTWAQQSHGAYLLRTNCTEQDPVKLWRWYIQLTQAEDAFRISKSDLHLRPVFHQKTARVEAHILVCFLTLAMWRTLEMWMHGKGLGDCSRQLLKEVSTVSSMDVVLPVRRKPDVSDSSSIEDASDEVTDLRLRVVARPDAQVAQLLARLGLELPTAPKLIENVVPKNPRQSS